MGTEFKVRCRECMEEFTIRQGGSMDFHLLHCDTCGKEKFVSLEDIFIWHVRYVKGLKEPFSLKTVKEDKQIQNNPEITSISRQEYDHSIEEHAGFCSCSGKFRLAGTPRCPKCRSSSYEKLAMTMRYD